MREKRVKTDKKWYIFLSLPVLFLSTWIYRDPNFDTSNMEVAYNKWCGVDSNIREGRDDIFLTIWEEN